MSKRKKSKEPLFILESKGSTPFDDAFKTEVSRLKELLIPVINEAFGTNYAADRNEVNRESSDHYLLAAMEEDGTKIPHRLTDSCLHLGDKYYHIECQSTEDGNILIRLVEYNMLIGLENIKTDPATGDLMVDLPMSSLIMLRSGGEGQPKKTTKTVIYRNDGQEIRLDIPVLHVQSYSQDDIYDKGLYFLIPYYSLRYEDTFRKLAKQTGRDENGVLEAESEYDKIYSELKQWFRRLKEAYEGNEITEDEGQKLAKISRLILNHVTQNLEHGIAERMVSAVGGKELELPGDREIIEAVKKALKQGREEEQKNSEKKMREVAINLLLTGDSPEKVSTCTGLDLKVVKRLKTNIAKKKAAVAET